MGQRCCILGDRVIKTAVGICSAGGGVDDEDIRPRSSHQRVIAAEAADIVVAMAAKDVVCAAISAQPIRKPAAAKVLNAGMDIARRIPGVSRWCQKTRAHARRRSPAGRHAAITIAPIRLSFPSAASQVFVVD